MRRLALALLVATSCATTRDVRTGAAEVGTAAHNIASLAATTETIIRRAAPSGQPAAAAPVVQTKQQLVTVTAVNGLEIIGAITEIVRAVIEYRAARAAGGAPDAGSPPADAGSP